ncbi:hypothetical protein GCM10025875_23780 [Litorihabitans aurantiacus]|uniref:Uncharacterized protein n=1 Tax=Litorihabitans aurantiacus TaxID=1930061 RepID=A0AA37XFS1_9MICO|nr:hypothetical protein GCM10025875_23780 [Litorihabitans aurantiacus]
MRDVAHASRASTTFAASPARMRATASATFARQASGVAAPGEEVTPSGKVSGARAASRGGGGAVGVDRRDPRAAAAAPDEHARDDERAAGGVAVVERERPERDQAGAGQVDVVGHRGALAQPLEPGVGREHAVGAGGVGAGGLAPRDHPVTASHPGRDVVGRGQEVEQIARIGDGVRADLERGNARVLAGRGGRGHRRQPTPARPATPGIAGVCCVTSAAAAPP